MNLIILRILALLEGISYLLILGVTMPLKYMYNNPEPNQYVGMAHGVLFMAYLIWVILVGNEKKWNLKIYFWAFIASIIPFGTFVADVKLFKK
jgi:integral membrane protein